MSRMLKCFAYFRTAPFCKALIIEDEMARDKQCTPNCPFYKTNAKQKSEWEKCAARCKELEIPYHPTKFSVYEEWYKVLHADDKVDADE